MAMPRINDAARRARIATRHLLAAGTQHSNVLNSISDALVGLHSSDPVSVFLSAGARMRDPSIPAIEAALYDEQSVVRHHAMRRTLWVMSPLVTGTAHAAATRKIARTERRRLIQWLGDTPGVADPEGWLADATALIVGRLTQLGGATTRQLGQDLPHLAIPITVGLGTRQETTIAAHSRVLLQAGLEGRVVRTRPLGSWIGSQYLWASADDWNMPDLSLHDDSTASEELARLWLGRFGPGTETDLKWWSGWTVSKTRAVLARIEAQEVLLDSGETGFVLPDDLASPEPEPWAALLPALDPTTMGWKERAWYLGKRSDRLFDRNGNAGPTIWLNGQVIGGWAQKTNGEIALEIHHSLQPDQRRLVDEQIGRVKNLVGDTRFRVRFPPRNQRDLLEEVVETEPTRNTSSNRVLIEAMSDGVLHRLSAFSKDPAGGNPAGVWIGARLPSAENMLRIAHDVGYSETAFLTQIGPGHYTVRYFSPEAEVPFCGHATIASGVLLGRTVGLGRYEFETSVGTVPVDVQMQDGEFQAALHSVNPLQRPPNQDLIDDALSALGWEIGDIDPAIEPTLGFAGAWHLILAARTKARLDALDYDFPRLRRLMLENDLTTIQLLWREEELVFHSRNPFPVGGVVEDPATGAAAAALGGYLRDAEIVAAPATVLIRQGEAMGRPSRLVVEIPTTGGIVVRGTAVDLPAE